MKNEDHNRLFLTWNRYEYGNPILQSESLIVEVYRMQVSKNNISQFLTTNNVCFMIPVYQRNYDWKEDNCKQLWDDIWFLTNSPKSTHFLGTICSSGIISHEKTIIDGQQRLTTVTLLVKAIHDSADNEDFKKDLKKTFMQNEGYGIEENHIVKLQLNPRDDAIYRKLLVSDTLTKADDLEVKMRDSRLYQNYLYFYDHVKKLNIQKKIEIKEALERLIIVELDIENEDPQEIFESLNSTGLDLTDVDLVRNYLLMSLDHETQKRMYTTYWYQIEENVGTENMVRFFIDYYIYARKSDNLMIRGRRSHISSGYVYLGFKEHYRSLAGKEIIHGAKPEITEELLKEMLRCSKFYKRLVFGEKTDMNSLNDMDRIIYSIIYINEAITSRPVLMYIMEKYLNGTIDETQALEMLNACLSMVFRSKVTKTTGMSGQFVGNMLSRLSVKDDSNYTKRFWDAITAGHGDFSFPNDEDFKYALMNRPIFDTLRSKGTKYLLYTLEQKSPSAKGLPRYDDQNITIEHVMPKTLSPEWEEYLGESKNRHSDFLNKLGNLTLTNNNPEMSNDPFDEKKKWYKESSFHYTRDLAKKKKWSIFEIGKRSKDLTEKCIDIWGLPDDYQNLSDEIETVNQGDGPKKRRSPFRFSMIGLQEGDEISFVDDQSKIATVVDDTHVEYEGKTYSLSKLASYLKGGTEANFNGPQYFLYDGETLSNLRDEHESYAYRNDPQTKLF